MKNERFTAKWEVLDSNQTVMQTLSNATQLTSAPYDLWPGLYDVRITASYWSSYFNLSDKTTVANITVNISGIPLVAGIDGPHYINASAEIPLPYLRP